MRDPLAITVLPSRVERAPEEYGNLAHPGSILNS
jgi:hypothetical protein